MKIPLSSSRVFVWLYRGKEKGKQQKKINMYMYRPYQQNMSENNGKCNQNPLLYINFDLDDDKKSDFCLSLDRGI